MEVKANITQSLLEAFEYAYTTKGKGRRVGLLYKENINIPINHLHLRT